MALTFDTFTNLASSTGTQSWSHAGSASTSGVIVVVSGGSVDETSGVTYGGVALDRIATGANTAGETGTTSVWFLGQSVPTGTQTAEVSRTAANAYIATVMTVVATSGATSVVTSDSNSSTTISTITTSLTIPNGVPVFMAGGLYSGENALSSITDNGDLTRLHSQDFGNFVSVINRRTAIYTGTGAAYTNFAWTQSSDDGAWAAIAIKEDTAITPKTGNDTGSFTASSETPSFAQVDFTRTDTGSFTATETPSFAQSDFSSSDSGSVSATETADVQSILSLVSSSDSGTFTALDRIRSRVSTEGTGGTASYVATASDNETFTSNTTVPKPAGTSNGDLVLVAVHRWASATGMTPADITPPAGAVLIDSLAATGTNNGGEVHTTIYGFVAGAETEYSFALDQSYWRSSTAMSFADADISDIANIVSNMASSTTTTLASTSAAATAGAVGAWFLGGQDYSGTPTYTSPTNYTEVLDTPEQSAAYRASLSAGTETASGGTATAAGTTISTLVIVPPSGGTPTDTYYMYGYEDPTISATDNGSVDTGAETIPKSANDSGAISATDSGTTAVVLDSKSASDSGTVTGTDASSAPVIQTEKYIQGISANGRYFLDQNGDPILMRGVAPWGALFNNTPAELESFWNAMKNAGFNAAMVSLVPDSANGADSASGQTFDGIAPFTTFPTLNETYWARMDAHIDMAADYGITLLIYPTDSWNTVSGGEAILSGESTTDLATYGTTLAQRWSTKPNLIWMTGGDYFEPFNDSQMQAATDAVAAELGASNIIRSSMLFHPEWTMRQTTGAWSESAGRVDFNFVYVYDVSYDLTQKAYNQHAFPALHGENKYLDEGADATIFRRNTIWALTSGAAGDIPFTADWRMSHNSWQTSFVNSPDPDFFQAEDYMGWFAGLTGWWELVPDVNDNFILTGGGTKINRTDYTEGDNQIARAGTNDYASATLKADGSMAVVYVPTQRAITIDDTLLGANPVGKWVHPTTLAETAIADVTVSITPPSAGDWLLYITADSSATPKVGSDTGSFSATDSGTVVVTYQEKTASDSGTLSVVENNTRLVSEGGGSTEVYYATTAFNSAGTFASNVSTKTLSLNSTTLGGYTPQVGDIIIAVMHSEYGQNATLPAATTTGGSTNTWTAGPNYSNGNNGCGFNSAYTTVTAAGAVTFTMGVTVLNDTVWSVLRAWVIPSGSYVGVPLFTYFGEQDTDSLVSLVTTQTSSIVLYAGSDWDASNTVRTYEPTGAVEDQYWRDGSHYDGVDLHWTGIAATTDNYGVTSPNGNWWVGAGIVIEEGSGGTTETLHLSSSDSATISASETSDLGGIAAKTSSDSGTLSATETASSDGTATVSDSGTLSATETAASDGTVTTSDAGTISVAESSDLAVSAATPSSDSGTLSVTEATDIEVTGQIAKSATDSGTLDVTETATVTAVTVEASDSGTLSGADAGAFVVVYDEKSASDSGTLSASESNNIVVSAETSDSGTLSATEVSDLPPVVTHGSQLDTTNTGPEAAGYTLTPWPFGSTNITTPNQTFEGYLLTAATGIPDIFADNITFRGCEFRVSDGGAWIIGVHDGATGTTFEDCRFRPANTSSTPVSYADSYQQGIKMFGDQGSGAPQGLVVRRTEFWGFGNAIEVEPENSTLTNQIYVEECWFHDAADQDNSVYHHDGILCSWGIDYVNIQRSKFYSGGNTNAIALQSVGVQNNYITIQDSYMGWGNYTVNLGDQYGSNNVTFTGNIYDPTFADPVLYGSFKNDWSSFGGTNVWTNNTRSDDGTYWWPTDNPAQTSYNHLTEYNGPTSQTATDSGTLSATETATVVVVYQVISANDSGSVTAAEIASSGGTGLGSDTGSVAAAETASTLSTSTRTDTGTLSVTESAEVGTSRSGNDSGTLSVTETTDVVISGGADKVGSDTGTLSATAEISALTITQYVVAGDSGTLQATEIAASAGTVNTSDAGTVTAVDGGVPGISVPASDSGTLSVTEGSAVVQFEGVTVNVWNGTQFVVGRMRVWDGTQFVDPVVRVWNGSGWVLYP